MVLYPYNFKQPLRMGQEFFLLSWTLPGALGLGPSLKPQKAFPSTLATPTLNSLPPKLPQCLSDLGKPLSPARLRSLGVGAADPPNRVAARGRCSVAGSAAAAWACGLARAFLCCLNASIDCSLLSQTCFQFTRYLFYVKNSRTTTTTTIAYFSSRMSKRGLTQNAVLFQKPLGPGQSSQQGLSGRCSPVRAEARGHKPTEPRPWKCSRQQPTSPQLSAPEDGFVSGQVQKLVAEEVPRGTEEEPAGVRSRRLARASRPAAPGGGGSQAEMGMSGGHGGGDDLGALGICTPTG